MPQATVAAMVVRTINGKESVLLTKRNVAPFKGLWCLPGGHIDLYETADIAVFREVKEETGIDYQGSFFGFMGYPLHSGKVRHSCESRSPARYCSYKHRFGFHRNDIIRYT